LPKNFWTNPNYQFLMSSNQKNVVKRFQIFKQKLESILDEKINLFNENLLPEKSILFTLLKDSADSQGRYNPLKLSREEIFQ
jgi:hypothetical protein